MVETEPTALFGVELQPVGRRVQVAPGVTVLEAVQTSGVELVSVCGGEGTCGTCRVRAIEGQLSAETAEEEDLLSATELADGWRLACQAQVCSPLRLEIPPESLSAPQRLQLEGQSVDFAPDPPVIAVDLVLEAPSLHDLRADTTRLREALAQAGMGGTAISLRSARTCSNRLRAQQWRGRAAIYRQTDGTEALVSIQPVGGGLLGLAVDTGTTKLAAYLVDLATGETLGRVGAMNPQTAYGEDVVTRITYANTAEGAAELLHERLVEELNRMVGELCEQTGAHRGQIVDAVVVGNTAMHHFVVGLPVRQLGEAPYVACVSDPVLVRAEEVGLQLDGGAMLYLPPNIAGYVGADHVAMLLASGLADTEQTVLALDIGTNTEISLSHKGEIWSCSTASGPAFEGAHIHDGMRAAPGAIEHMRFHQGAFQVQTIGGARPIGICGSGILDAVAQGLEAGIIDERGSLVKDHPLVSRTSSGPTCLLVPAGRAGHGRDVVFTRSDVNEIQLAKGAIRAGTELLLEEAGIGASSLDSIVVAGAFGTYLDLESAIRVGLLVDVARERYRQVGNAAGRGAEQLLLSRERRALADRLAKRVRYVELTVHGSFTDMFTKSLGFGRGNQREMGAPLADWPNSGLFREPLHSDKVRRGLTREPRGEANHVELESTPDLLEFFVEGRHFQPIPQISTAR
jgi:uncharacterized 2Fe-2S/4Fe-4S cluster protein (DUF4445 family)